MIDEMICVFDSPGSVSAVIIIALLSDIDKRKGAATGHNNGNVLRGCFARYACAPSWLAAESVSAISSGCRLSQQ
jgi:hypothetical protein